MNFTISLDSIEVQEQKAIYLSLKEKFENMPSEPADSINTFLDMNLWDFMNGIDKRTSRLLQEHNLYSLRQLRSLKESDLRKIPGVGSRTIRNVEIFLKEVNMRLATE